MSAALLIRSKRALNDFLARPSRPHKAILVFGLMMKLSLGGTKVCERYSGIMGSPYLLQTDCNFKCLASIASEKLKLRFKKIISGCDNWYYFLDASKRSWIWIIISFKSPYTLAISNVLNQPHLKFKLDFKDKLVLDQNDKASSNFFSLSL